MYLSAADNHPRSVQRPSPAAPSTGPWRLLHTDRDSRHRLVTIPGEHYPTREACTAAMRQKWEPLLALIEQQAASGPLLAAVTRQPDRLRWETRAPQERQP